MRKVVVTALVAAVLAGGFTLVAAQIQDRPGISARSREGKPVIARVWHGKTPRAKADEYERYLSDAIKKFPDIPGNLGYQLLRVDGAPGGDAYSEFQVTSYWESLDAIKSYAGKDIGRTHDLPRDREFLVDPEPFVRNYQLRVNAVKP